jgi:hypothetical protein
LAGKLEKSGLNEGISLKVAGFTAGNFRFAVASFAGGIIFCLLCSKLHADRVVVFLADNILLAI